MYDCIVIGGGVIGTAILDALALRGFRSLLLEKEDDVATGASRANSGIVHAGYDAEPDTLKAKFNVEGNKIFESLCGELDVPYKKTGSLVLSRDKSSELLKELYLRGLKNGVDVEIVNRKRIEKIQPDLQDELTEALWAKDAGIVSPYKLTIAFCDRAILNGAKVELNANVTEIAFKDNIFYVKTQNKEYLSKFLINAAGAEASSINELLNDEIYHTEYRKGEYYVLDKFGANAINTVLFPLPDEKGKGILVAPTADGNVIYGPTSERCEKGDTSCSLYGLNAVRDGVGYIIKNPNYRQIIREYAGVRAIIGNDFLIKWSNKYSQYFIIAGICSPGLTSAPAIGRFVAEEMAKKLTVDPPINPVKYLYHKSLSRLSDEELNDLIKLDERWGRIICRCEKVTEAEIINAIRSPLPATTVDAVKRRVRAGMGRCQGGFCAPRVIDILSRELNIPVSSVKKGGEGSEMIKCRIKEADDENL